jgi:hypothetical protein
MSNFTLPTMEKGKTRAEYEAELYTFAENMKAFRSRAGFKISSRSWCYQLEGMRLINKDQFSRVENLINKCRENGLLPIDFVPDEDARKFSGVEVADSETAAEYIVGYLDAARKLCRDAIEKHLGADALQRFKQVRQAVIDKFRQARDVEIERDGVMFSFEDVLSEAIDAIKNGGEQ